MVEPGMEVEVLLHNLQLLGVKPEEPRLLAVENTGLVQGARPMVVEVLGTPALWRRLAGWAGAWRRPGEGRLAVLVALASPTTLRPGELSRLAEHGRRGRAPPPSWPWRGLAAYLPEVLQPPVGRGHLRSGGGGGARAQSASPLPDADQAGPSEVAPRAFPLPLTGQVPV
jgi:hypothetical protein